jgi:hypothetical protein
MSLMWLEAMKDKTVLIGELIQGMGCEGACAHTHVRCAVAHVRVRAK